MIAERILIVAPSTQDTLACQTALQQSGVVDAETTTETLWQQAVERLQSEIFDVVLVESRITSFDTIESEAAKTAETRFVVYTPAGDISAESSAEIDRRNSVLDLSKSECYQLTGTLANVSFMVRNFLEHNSRGGHLSATSLSSFLQVMSLDQKTCILRLNSVGPQQHRGVLFLKRGELQDARFQNYRGEPAVDAICAWADVDLRIENGRTAARKTIQRNLHQVLLEAATSVDESDDETYINDEPEIMVPDEVPAASMEPSVAIEPAAELDDLEFEVEDLVQEVSPTFVSALHAKMNIKDDQIASHTKESSAIAKLSNALLAGVGETSATYTVISNAGSTVTVITSSTGGAVLTLPARFSRQVFNTLFTD